VDDFGALNDALPDPETTEEAPCAPTSAATVEDLPLRVAEGAPDALAAAVPTVEDPTAEAVETMAEVAAETTAEAPAASGPSQVA
jgi:hypothetical protein